MTYVLMLICRNMSNLGACYRQRHLISLELELQTVVSYSVWMLGAKLKFCRRACSYCRYISSKLPNMLRERASSDNSLQICRVILLYLINLLSLFLSIHTCLSVSTSEDFFVVLPCEEKATELH